MGLNEVMAGLRERKASHPVSQPPKEQGMILSRHERDRITEALRIAVNAKKAKLAIAKEFNATATQTATLRQQVTDFNELICKFRNETARTI